MHKGCVKAVLSQCKSVGTNSNLNTVSTSTGSFSLAWQQLVGSLCAGYNLLGRVFKQAFLVVFHPLNTILYSFSTGPNTTNKLIKDLYI